MKSIVIKVVSAIVAVAAIIGIKMMDLPGLITALLTIAVVMGMIFIMAGAFEKKKSVETQSVQSEKATETPSSETSIS
jgi:hypothetical protein